MPDVGPVGWPESWPAGASTRSASTVDASMIATARQLAPDSTWVLGDIAGSTSADTSTWWSWPATSPSSRRRAPRPLWWPAAPATSAPDGRLIAGFQLDRGYALAAYDEHCRLAGLAVRRPVGHLVRVTRSPTAALRGVGPPQAA